MFSWLLVFKVHYLLFVSYISALRIKTPHEITAFFAKRVKKYGTKKFGHFQPSMTQK
jgi:hypothetical protein